MTAPGSASDDDYLLLLTSDLAQQVRQSFEEMLEFGASVTAATQETVHRFSGALDHDQEGPVVILALAVLQVRHREVHASIRDAALELLRSGQAQRLIASDPAARRHVREILSGLRELLESLEDGQEEDEDEE